jgi:hypothetical protein
MTREGRDELKRLYAETFQLVDDPPALRRQFHLMADVLNREEHTYEEMSAALKEVRDARSVA